MAIDFLAPFGEDLVLGEGSDVRILGQRGSDFDFVESRDELIQRIVRRLLTNPGEWIPFPKYGAGLRRYVGETLSGRLALQIKNDCLTQIVQEPDVSTLPAPIVTFTEIDNGVIVLIQLYTKALQPVNFAFNPNVPGLFSNINNIFAGASPLGA